MKIGGKTATAVRHPRGVVPAAVLATLLIYALPEAADLLQFDRGLIGQGQWWRIVTSHWTHWNESHLLWDLLMFAALSITALRISKTRAYAVVLSSALLIPLSILILIPDMICYRGLSGLDSALYVFVLLGLIKNRLPAVGRPGELARISLERTALWLMLLLFAAKTIYEFATGNTLFVQSMGAGICGVPLAHLIGGIIGVIWSTLSAGRHKTVHPQPVSHISCSVDRPRPIFSEPRERDRLYPAD